MSATHARYIWNDPQGEGRNRYVLFRRSFRLEQAPREGTLYLFADTRYRLLVNGRTVCHGPGRFYCSKPEYDAVELTPYLREGENAIAVMVNSYGAVSFHSEKSIGGLIAWGTVRDAGGHEVELATGRAWRAIESPGHRRDTHDMSFALNTSEQHDGRSMPADWAEPDFDDRGWPPAVLQQRPAHWGDLQPRSIPMLDERRIEPTARLAAFAAPKLLDETWYSLMVNVEGKASRRSPEQVAVRTHLHSPRKQETTLGVFWGRYFLNGKEVEPRAVGGRSEKSRRQELHVTLEEGWNSLLVFERFGTDWWDFYLGVPNGCDIAVSAEQQIDSPHTFLIGGPWRGDQADAAAQALPLEGDLPLGLGDWKPWPRDASASAEYKERAWRAFEKIDGGGEILANVPALAKQIGGDTLALLYDFEGEMLGRPVLEYTAAEGTTVDLAYTERLLDNGAADIHGRYHVDMMERYICRDGRQRWHTMHPRGFRYLEVLISGDLSKFQLHDLAITNALYPVEYVGEFECSDERLNAIWKLGRDTAHCCMEDAYLDTPWRERGCYSGDFLVEFYANFPAFGDTALFRRCIEQFLLGQTESGMIQPSAHHGWHANLSDYSAILVSSLRHYWQVTADTDFVEACFPAIRRMVLAFDWLFEDDGLLVDAERMGPYIDLSKVDKKGVNCALNCFFVEGYRDAARLAALVGEPELETQWQTRAQVLADTIRSVFWDDSQGVFLDRRPGDVDETGPSVPGNSLAIVFDIADDEQKRRAVEWVADRMADNFDVEFPTDNKQTNVTSYFSFYAIGALYHCGRVAEAEDFMRRYWGHMLDHGAWTCWEYFADNGGASRSHAWSACPTWYLSHKVLGVHLRPGEPNRVVIQPHVGTLDHARGVFAHPAGPIHVEWRRTADGVDLNVEAPAEISIEQRDPILD